MEKNVSYAPGMRIEVRNEEWTIRRVDSVSKTSQLIICEGVSELVLGKEAHFLTDLESKIHILDPAETKLVEDPSSNYKASLLYIESLLRKRVPTGEKIYLGHQAAMDSLPYQLDPTKQALQQPRQRILIADNVGLGKTLEAGILMSELMRRGKGKRILVLAVKSMLTQFQKEMWNRFSIPLTRLDSAGIQRVRNKIPTNHNPFHYYDKAIISIDTLKSDVEYRHHLEQAYWDIIVIDEAHNVAERGSNSQRSRLAKLLSQRSDTMIMLSATPHDGKPESFASLMNMLDATAIADRSNYSHDDFKDKGLIVRRFKKDVKDQISGEFPERNIEEVYSTATLEEERVYDLLAEAKIGSQEQGKKSGRLLKVSFEKALFSSPMACLSTVNNRLQKLENKLLESEDEELQEEVNSLESLKLGLQKIDAPNFSKYQSLVDTIQKKTNGGLNWKKNKTNDRLVIFTESIPTLDFLYHNLRKDLNLKVDETDINKSEIVQMHGGMSDAEVMDIVESFGKEQSKIRVLVCSDVASEGINLHYLSHKMIHFDIPWSLMAFQQRNGRIDRYGQQVQPQIRYLLTKCESAMIKGDSRILEVLINKDEQAQENIGDPSEFLQAYTQADQEQVVAEHLADGDAGIDLLDMMLSMGEEDALSNQADSNNPMDLFMGDTPVSTSSAELTGSLSSLYKNEVEYCENALTYLREQGLGIEFKVDAKQQLVSLTAPNDLRYRFGQLAPEVKPENWQFILTENTNTLTEEIIRCRSDQEAWPKMHYLWQLNPVVQWLNDKLQSAVFRRHEAPIVRMPQQVAANCDHYILSGLYPNRKSHPMLNPWVVVTVENGTVSNIQTFEDAQQNLQLDHSSIPNSMAERSNQRQMSQLPMVIEKAQMYFDGIRSQEDKEINQKLSDQLESLENLRGKRMRQLELKFEENKQSEKMKLSRKEQQQREIDTVFDNYIQWIEDTMTIEEQPYIQVVAVITGAEQ